MFSNSQGRAAKLDGSGYARKAKQILSLEKNQAMK